MEDIKNNPLRAAYRTLKGYESMEEAQMTHAMEDYLEMICRRCGETGYVRINSLAAWLGVKPSSSSKMVQNLRELGFVEFEKYGVIRPTAKGAELGKYLLHRHDVLHRLFCLINHSEDELEQTEKVEHFINPKTLRNIERLIALLAEE